MTDRTRMARLLDAVTHTGPGYTLTPATEHPMTDRAQLHHLADRARRGVLLPAEGALLADAVAELEARLEDWKQAAGAGMTLTDNLRAERDALAAGVPLVCSDERHKTKVFALEMRVAELERRHQALHVAHVAAAKQGGKDQAAIERVRALPRSPQVQARIQIHGVPGQEDYNRGWSSAISAVRAALDQPQPPTA